MRNTNEVLVGRSARQRMSTIELIVHTVLTLGTCGFWLPVYLARKRQVGRNTLHYDRRDG